MADDVHLSHHTGIYGEVAVGNRVHIMAGCFATRAVGDDVTLQPRPLRLRPAGSHVPGQTADMD